MVLDSLKDNGVARVFISSGRAGVTGIADRARCPAPGQAGRRAGGQAGRRAFAGARVHRKRGREMINAGAQGQARPTDRGDDPFEVYRSSFGVTRITRVSEER